MSHAMPHANFSSYDLVSGGVLRRWHREKTAGVQVADGGRDERGRVGQGEIGEGRGLTSSVGVTF